MFCPYTYGYPFMMHNPWLLHTPYNPYHGHLGHYVPFCPVCYQTYHLCHCVSKPAMILPQEVWVDPSSSPREVFIGGISDVRLSLEYMPVSGASTPSVKVNITSPGGSTSTWSEDPISGTYNVKADFSTAAPGTRIELIVTEAMARLRWFEVIQP